MPDIGPARVTLSISTGKYEGVDAFFGGDNVDEVFAHISNFFGAGAPDQVVQVLEKYLNKVEISGATEKAVQNLSDQGAVSEPPPRCKHGEREMGKGRGAGTWFCKEKECTPIWPPKGR